MIAFIRKRLELKIILVLAFVVACSVGLYTYADMLHVRSDMIRTSERTLGAFAAAIKGSVSASMKEGQHEIAQLLLREVQTPAFVMRLIIYNDRGRPLYSREVLSGENMPDMTLSPDILKDVQLGDRSIVIERDRQPMITYYSPLENGPKCHRCHGSRSRLNGVLRIDFSLSELADLLDARRNRDILWSLGLILLLIAVLAVLLRRFVHVPVRELRDAMIGAANGGGTSALSLDGSDELGDLKRSFVAMLDRIRLLHQSNVDTEVQLAHAREVARFRNELQTMFDVMPDGVLMVARDLRIVQYNFRVAELLPHVQGAEFVCSAPDEDPQGGLLAGLRAAFREGVIVERQLSLMPENGPLRHLYSICAPVVDSGEVVYVVGIIRDITERMTTERDLAERTAELRRTNRLLSRLAVTDSLTQLYNRRHFDELLFKEIKRFNRRKYTSLSLMMIDIDHFKALNDRHGHLVGDIVLREVAMVLKQDIRETDTVARYGGEEFVVIMPDTHIDGAGYKADMLRRRVQAMEFRGSDRPIGITISIGVAEYAAGFPRDFIHMADKALYEAKQGGRNTVVVKRRDEVER